MAITMAIGVDGKSAGKDLEPSLLITCGGGAPLKVLKMVQLNAAAPNQVANAFYECMASKYFRCIWGEYCPRCKNPNIWAIVLYLFCVLCHLVGR
jgi:hypothetical protein